MNAGPSSSWGNLELLKELMLGDEQRALAVLRERLDGLEEESVERLSRDLAAAIRLREELGDAAFDDFAEALGEILEHAEFARNIRVASKRGANCRALH